MIWKTICAAALATAFLTAAADALPLTRAQEKRIKPVGKPLKCITIRAIQSTHVRNDRTIDFYMKAEKAYRSRLPRRCPGLTAQERFSFTTDLPQICYVDSITVLRTAEARTGPSCRLGRFQRISGAPMPKRR